MRCTISAEALVRVDTPLENSVGRRGCTNDLGAREWRPMVLNTGEAGAMTTTRMLETAEAEVAYDVRGPLPTTDGRPPLFMIGQPMDASGFVDVFASYFPDHTVVTYDPRGLGRSSRKDGQVDNAPSVQAIDVHAVIEALDVGPVEMFASNNHAAYTRSRMARSTFASERASLNAVTAVPGGAWRSNCQTSLTTMLRRGPSPDGGAASGALSSRLIATGSCCCLSWQPT